MWTRRAESLLDTIVACATPPGEGGIAVVRLSGDSARSIAARLAPAEVPRRSHVLSRARVLDGAGQLIDDGMVVEMHAPRSYTGEDVVELHLHGARCIVQAVLQACQGLGARLAGPGEFTLRAVMHGKMDLSQAEALADLIAAASEQQMRVAARSLRGGVSRKVSSLLERMEVVLAQWRAALDFPEDCGEGAGVDVPSVAQRAGLTEVAEEVGAMISRARLRLRQGRKVVLCGPPNVGKSSLLNAWCGDERALVDPAPGTTRDPVEVEVATGSSRWFLCDTAGVRAEGGELERRGMELAMRRAAEADVVLWLISVSELAWPEERLGDVVVIGGKADLASDADRRRLEAEAEKRGRPFGGWVSVVSGEGLVAVQRRLAARMDGEPVREGEAVVVRERQLECLRRAAGALSRLEAEATAGGTLDVLSMELEEGAKALGEILGRDVDGSVLDRIFSDFCIGK